MYNMQCVNIQGGQRVDNTRCASEVEYIIWGSLEDKGGRFTRRRLAMAQNVQTWTDLCGESTQNVTKDVWTPGERPAFIIRVL